MATAAEPKLKKSKPKVSIHLHIPKEHSMHKNFSMKGLSVGKSHHLHLHGKINSISEDEYGKSLGLDVEHIGEKGEGSKGESVGEIIRGLHTKKDGKKGGAEEEG